MLEFLTVIAVAGLLVLGLLATAVWRLYRRLRRSRLITTAHTVVAVGAPLLATCRPAALRNRAPALRLLRLTRAQRDLRRRVADATRAGTYLGDVPAMLPRLQAETDLLRAGLGRLPGGHPPVARERLAA